MSRERKPTPNGKPPACYSRTSAEWPCIFPTPLATERLDPAVKKLWETRRDDRPKWGDLRTTFRRSHCRLVNPWGSETCPFKPEDCALAFYQALEHSLDARNPYAYFITVCKSMGAARADLGVELRARMRTDDANEGAMGRTSDPSLRERSADGIRAVLEGGSEPSVVRVVQDSVSVRGVRGVAAQPTALRDVLGGLDLRPRPQPGQDSDEEEG